LGVCFLILLLLLETRRILINRLDSLRSPGINGSPAFPSPHLSPGMGLVKDRAEERGLFEHDIDGLMIHDPLS
jgi:hypothetical protein